MGINFNTDGGLRSLHSCYHYINGSAKRITGIYTKKDSSICKIWEDEALKQNVFIYSVNNENKAFISFDNCITWEEINIPRSGYQIIMYVNNKWYAFEDAYSDILFSYDGKEWNSLNKKLKSKVYNAIYMNNKFFTFGSSCFIYDKDFNSLEQKVGLPFSNINSSNGVDEFFTMDESRIQVSTINADDLSIKETLSINNDGGNNIRFASEIAIYKDGKYIMCLHDRTALTTSVYQTDCKTLELLDQSLVFQKTSFSEYMSIYNFKGRIIGVVANGDDPTFFYLSENNTAILSTKIKDIDSDVLPYNICNGLFIDNKDVCLYVGQRGKRYITYDGINWEYNGTSSSSVSESCDVIAHSTNGKYINYR